MATDTTGETLSGLLYDEVEDVQVPFTVTEHNHKQGGIATPVEEVQSGTEGIPKDANCTTIKEFDLEAFAELVKDISVETSGKRNMSAELPPTLTALAVTWNTSESAGSGSAATLTTEFTFGGTLSSKPRATAQGSAGVQPSIIDTESEPFAASVPVMNYSFYIGTIHDRALLRAKATRFAITGGTFTVTIATPAVFTKSAHGFPNGTAVALTTDGALPTGLSEDTLYYVINTATNTFRLARTVSGTAINTTGTQSGTNMVRAAILDWPHFKPESLTFLLLGQEVSVQAEADSTATLSAPATGPGHVILREKGSSSSYSVTLTTQEKRISPTLHGIINVSNTSLPSNTATATVVANTIELVGGDGTAAVITNEPIPTSKVASGSVTPTTTSATSPADIPRTGIYFFDSQLNSTKYGRAYVTVTTVDMSYFA